MAKKPSPEYVLMRFSRRKPEINEIFAHFSTFHRMNHRSAAILGATLVEDMLEDCIMRRFRSMTPDEENALFVEDGPLANCSTKIKLARALGILGTETARELTTLNRIRNAFAHAKKPISFDIPQVARVCETLQIVFRFKPVAALMTFRLPQHPKTPAEHFLFTCEFMWLGLVKDRARQRITKRPIRELAH